MKVLSIALFLLIAFGHARAADEINLDWLAGAWCSQSAQVTSEEHWMRSKGGLMLGMSRTLTKRGTEFEFVRIELSNGGRRFVALPSGQTETTFQLSKFGERSVTFVNPEHDFPKRIRYWREGDRLFARIDAGADDANFRVFEWARCPPD